MNLDISCDHIYLVLEVHQYQHQEKGAMVDTWYDRKNYQARWYDGKEGGREGTPAPNRLGDQTGRHFEEGVEVQAPA